MEDWKKIEMRERDMEFLTSQSTTNPFILLINVAKFLFALGLAPVRLAFLLLTLIGLPFKLLLSLWRLTKR